MELNYAVIINYLTDVHNIQGQEIADWLNSSPETISRIKNNKKDMIKSIRADDFFDNIFKKNHPSRFHFNRQEADQLYKYIEKCGITNQDINVSYSDLCNCGSQITEEACKKFIQTVIGAASYKAFPDNADTSEPPSSAPDTITFPKFNNPIHNCVFIGRESMFSSIQKTLDQFGTCIIYGIGGLGKSYCSLKYAEEFSGRYTQIQQVFFNTDITSTLLKIKFNNFDDSHFSEDEKLEKRFSILESFSENTLLIIDNMDACPSDRDKYERLKQMKMHILFTSRETDIDSKRFLVPIEPLSQEEQLCLFKNFCEFEIDDDNLHEYYELFKKIDGHTLLIELIAKTMSESDFTPSEMMEILSSTDDDDDISQISIEKDNMYQQEKMNKYVTKLFDTSRLNEKQKNVLMHLSLTEIGGIRRKLFKSLLGCDNNDINVLINQSWIIKNYAVSGSDAAKIHLHPVIRSAVISNTEPSIEKCIGFITKIIPTYKNDDGITLYPADYLDLCDILINAKKIFTFNASHLKLIEEASDILWKQRLYVESYKFYCLGIDLLDENSLPKMKISFYEKAARAAVRLANYNDAKTYYEKAIAITESKELSLPSKLASLYDNLGVVMRKDSKYEEALDYLTKAQNVIDIHHLSDSTLTANIYNDMGVIYINLKVYDKALENYQKAKEIRENATSPDKEQLAYSYHNIGTVYQRQNDYEHAIEWHKKALEIRREIYPDKEPIIASSLTMIGNDYTYAARAGSPSHTFEDARKYFFDALNIRIETLGENHPDTAWSHYSIAEWYFYQEDYEHALQQYTKCLSIRKNKLDKSHAYTASALKGIGNTYIKLQRYDDAKAYLLQALEIYNTLNMVRDQEEVSGLLTTIK